MSDLQPSKNELARAIVGLRSMGPFSIIIDLPAEVGYHCPVCRYSITGPNGEIDERLHWSEYNGFIWCEVCNRDYPSAFCLVSENIDRAIEVFLLTVQAAIDYALGDAWQARQDQSAPATLPLTTKDLAYLDTRENFFDAIRDDPQIDPDRRAKWLALEPKEIKPEDTVE